MWQTMDVAGTQGPEGPSCASSLTAADFLRSWRRLKAGADEQEARDEEEDDAREDSLPGDDGCVKADAAAAMAAAAAGSATRPSATSEDTPTKAPPAPPAEDSIAASDFSPQPIVARNARAPRIQSGHATTRGRAGKMRREGEEGRGRRRRRRRPASQILPRIRSCVTRRIRNSAASHEKWLRR